MVVHDMLHIIRTQCVGSDVQRMTTLPCERACWREDYRKFTIKRFTDITIAIKPKRPVMTCVQWSPKPIHNFSRTIFYILNLKMCLGDVTGRNTGTSLILLWRYAESRALSACASVIQVSHLCQADTGAAHSESEHCTARNCGLTRTLTSLCALWQCKDGTLQGEPLSCGGNDACPVWRLPEGERSVTKRT